MLVHQPFDRAVWTRCLSPLVADALLACVIMVYTIVPAIAAGADAIVGKRAENFSLADANGNTHTLAQYQDSDVVVVVFLGIDCPLAKVYMPRLDELAREFSMRSVILLGVYSNSRDKPSELAGLAKASHIGFPLLRDAGNTVADQFNATRTPEVFVLDQHRVVRYHGRIDDQYNIGARRGTPFQCDLRVAVQEVLAEREVTIPSTDVAGCMIERVRRIAPSGSVTYTKDIAAILERRCVSCHRKGEVAPFPLTTFNEVSGWAETIHEVIKTRRMPPWFANPRYGVFANDCSLDEKEIQAVNTWIDNGCPEGDQAEGHSRHVFEVGWGINKPDVVYTMPYKFNVPAEGTLQYQYFTVDSDVKQDLWVTSAEARPGNAAVVHHLVFCAVAPGVDLRFPAEVQTKGQIVAIYAPGMNAWQFPEGMALHIEKGSQLILQAHYTPNGNALQDRSYVGLHLAHASTIKAAVVNSMAMNWNIRIAPYASFTQHTASVVFQQDNLLLSLFPHMHYRGKSFRFEALYVDGHREILLDVPRYDFNWQLRYDLAQPKLLPKGTLLTCIGTYDNSEDNLSNPDPSKTVSAGFDTNDEMLIGYFTVAPIIGGPSTVETGLTVVALFTVTIGCGCAVMRRSVKKRRAVGDVRSSSLWPWLFLVIACLTLVLELSPTLWSAAVSVLDLRLWTWRVYTVLCAVLIMLLVMMKARYDNR